jgi:hypothetical protein
MRQHDGTRPGDARIDALVTGHLRDSRRFGVRVGKEQAMTGYARRRDNCG